MSSIHLNVQVYQNFDTFEDSVEISVVIIGHCPNSCFETLITCTYGVKVLFYKTGNKKQPRGVMCGGQGQELQPKDVKLCVCVCVCVHPKCSEMIVPSPKVEAVCWWKYC
ncbi:uncharacterized protein [Euwallacea similis]|uniref:uncharacterized protein n=1 Tax=Euwallacea similis TaxID=1736056 RepID=UPI00344E09D4